MGIAPPGNYYFLVPWVALIPWYGMLIAMLACWALQGHPIYWFMHEDQFPVYISDIGATNLQPLFIACVAWQGLWYCILVASEFWQRSGHWPFKWLIHRRHQISKDPTPDESAYGSDMTQRVWYAELLVGGNYLMPPYFTKHERNLIFASFVLGVFGELAILMCTIFSTAKYKRIHLSMVGLFISFMFFSVLCNIVQYFMMGRHYAKTHPLAALGSEKRVSYWGCSNSGHIWNKYTISAIAKVIWLLLGAAWAFCFGGIRNRSTSACFEWLLAFWFGVYYIIASVDFYVGGRYMESKYFRQIESFTGYYKYDQLILSEPKIHLERFTDVSKRANSQDDMQTTDIVV